MDDGCRVWPRGLRLLSDTQRHREIRLQPCPIHQSGGLSRRVSRSPGVGPDAQAPWPLAGRASGGRRSVLLGGLVRMLFPVQLAHVAAGVVQAPGVLPGAAIVQLLLGIFFWHDAYGCNWAGRRTPEAHPGREDCDPDRTASGQAGTVPSPQSRPKRLDAPSRPSPIQSQSRNSIVDNLGKSNYVLNAPIENTVS